MILFNELYVLIKGFLYNYLKFFGEWEKLIVLVYYFGGSVRVLIISDGNIGLWMIEVFWLFIICFGGLKIVCVFNNVWI